MSKLNPLLLFGSNDRDVWAALLPDGSIEISEVRWSVASMGKTDARTLLKLDAPTVADLRAWLAAAKAKD